MSNKSNNSPQTNLKCGVIIWGTKNIYRVLDLENVSLSGAVSDKSIECWIKGKRGKRDGIKTFLLAGDIVHYLPVEPLEHRKGVIVERVDRVNQILRKRQAILHPIAVNLDALVIVSSLISPPLFTHFIDRMIYLATQASIPVILVINKLDLVDKTNSMNYQDAESHISADTQAYLEVYKSLNVNIVLTSTIRAWGIEALYAHITALTIRTHLSVPTVALVGQSGVGKSSLINSLMPNSQRATGMISRKYNRGTHITTRPEMLFKDTFAIIDTPGIKTVFPEKVDRRALVAAYPDVFQYADDCKLSNCTHIQEPECKVLPLIGSKILKKRYESYVSLCNEMYVR